MNQFLGSRGVAKLLLLTTLCGAADGGEPDKRGPASGRTGFASDGINTGELQPAPEQDDFNKLRLPKSLSEPATKRKFPYISIFPRSSRPPQATSNHNTLDTAPLQRRSGESSETRENGNPNQANDTRSPGYTNSQPNPGAYFNDNPVAEKPHLRTLPLPTDAAIDKNPSEDGGPRKKGPQNIKTIPDLQRPPADQRHLPIASDFGLHKPDPTQLSNTPRRKN